MPFTRNNDGSYNISAAALYDLVSQLDMTQLAKDAGFANGSQPTPTPVPSPVPAPQPTIPTNHKGIYAFSAGNSPQLATHPSVAGINLIYPWICVNPSQGSYNWNMIDSDMKPWIDNGKSIILRIASVGWKQWGPPKTTTNSWVPDDVLKGIPTTTSGDGTVKPQYWHPQFVAAWSTFVKALAAKYDGHPNIAAIQICIGDGGETKPDTHNDTDRLTRWQKIGYTDDVWMKYITDVMDLYKSAFTQTPIVIMPDASFISTKPKYGMSNVLDEAVKRGIWLQDNGVKVGQTLKSADWSKVPVIAEQRNSTDKSGDTLEQDLIQGIVNEHAQMMLCFASDLAKSDPALLAKYTAMIK